ncbi:MAG: alpha/beta hydrolase [Pseudomonadota bacterium]
MKSGVVKVDDELDLFYEESGHGDIPILFVPGWTMSTAVFKRQLSHYENSDRYRFITLDPRAHGRSSNTADGHFYEQHGRDLYAFIEALDLQNVVLGGWSFGTLHTLAYVEQFGAERLAGFVMIDGPPRATGHDSAQEWVTYTYEDHDRSQEFFTCGKLRDRDNTNRMFAAWMLENKSEENIRWLIDITQQTPDTAASLLNATAVYLDYRDTLIELHNAVPLLYYMRHDQLSVAEDWAREFTPQARVHAHGEHMMFWEEAERFNHNLGEFLAGIRV